MFKAAHDKLNQWYQQHGRHDLPWRNIDDAYKIWVSEIMLQQTQVKTVLERFYFPFLKSFPTLEDLANADLDAVLKKWEGLGYYTRARNLHKTAQIVKDTLPQSVHELIQLPGIGQSTAHAIASFAYKTPVPIMDANVKRILYRLFAISACSDKVLWQKAYEFFDPQRPYDFNQAMMDLGAMVCTAKNPSCNSCPYEAICQGKADPLSFPKKKAKKSTPQRHKTIVVHRYQNRYALQQRTGRFLHGLWGFHEFDADYASDALHYLGEVTQVYSHFTLKAKVYQSLSAIEHEDWFSLDELNTLALSGADHKVLALLREPMLDMPEE